MHCLIQWASNHNVYNETQSTKWMYKVIVQCQSNGSTDPRSSISIHATRLSEARFHVELLTILLREIISAGSSVSRYMYIHVPALEEDIKAVPMKIKIGCGLVLRCANQNMHILATLNPTPQTRVVRAAPVPSPDIRQPRNH